MDGIGCLRSTQSSTQAVDGDEIPLTWKDGLRLVDLYELAKQMHCKTCSSLLDLINIKNETRWGLASVLSVLCCCCQTLNDIYTGKMNETTEGKTEFEVNMKASASLLLCGVAGQHVVNFLAVLNVPKPSLYDTSTTVTSSLPSPCKDVIATSSFSVSSCVSLSSRDRTPQEGVYDQHTTSSPPVVSRIKTEGDEAPSENSRKKPPKIPSPCVENDSRKSQRGRKRKVEDSAKDKVMAEEEEEAEDVEDVYFGDVYKEEESIVQKVVPQKHYRCPVCGRVLPSSRGFHIHVVRKHQAANLQAIHHELGPNEVVSTDSKENSVGDAVSLTQPSTSAFTSPAHSLPFTSVTDRKISATVKSSTASSSLSKTSTSKTQRTQKRDLDSGAKSSKPDDVTKKRGRVSRKVKLGSEDSKVLCGVGDCDQTFKTEALYQKHLQKAHGTKTPFACPQCPKQYRSQKSLNIHMTVAHCSKDERKAVCKYCGDTVQHRRALKRHIKALHPRGAKKTFYCDECPMTFSQPCALKYHKLRHAGIKNYQCFYCDKKFSGSGNRLNHMRYFHEKERKFLCDTCGMGFFRAYALREHERVHSGEKPYQCERCAERFTKKEYLTIHMRTHTGEKPYKCELCDKAFTQRTSRSIHRRKVHGMKKQEPSGGKTQKEVVVNNKIIFVNS